jgi:hypothetical protein
MYIESPVAALIQARRAMVSDGVLVVALSAEPERVPYFSLPRRVLQKYRALPSVDYRSPGTFRYANSESFRHHLDQAGFRVRNVEELEVPVMEAKTADEVITWARAFGLTRLLNDLPEQTQNRWEEDFATEVEGLRRDGLIQLGGVTRIVVADCAGLQ